MIGAVNPSISRLDSDGRAQDGRAQDGRAQDGRAQDGPWPYSYYSLLIMVDWLDCGRIIAALMLMVVP
jgi:hypothetical protein